MGNGGDVGEGDMGELSERGNEGGRMREGVRSG